MSDWSRSRVLPNGIELLEASFDRHVYERHVHDTFAIGVTLSGVQRFWCRGATNDSIAGNVMVIRPGEVHDGRSGTPGSYSYRMMYVPVSLILTGSEPSSSRTILDDPILGRRVHDAWRALAHREDSLAADELFDDAIAALAIRAPQRDPVDAPMLDRVRDYLRAHVDANVRANELASIASMSRFQLTRQFQRRFGLPLHAYHLHLRLEEAKRRLRLGTPIAQVAADLGFVDQSHLHRRFKGAFGTTPDVWRRGVAAQKSKIRSPRGRIFELEDEPCPIST
ncbi:MAG TPA: AraC family transcriptional regulator [Thermoanaerobaculia bacterium]|nr:AraC family transcriptional regulator [Thermoanaerobaculia bacterium]